MKFVHIADMHFDTPFTVLEEKAGLGEKRRLEQREILKKAIEYIKENHIPFFLLSGDLYENEYVRQSTIEYINKLFLEIPDTKIFISPGNHDPYLRNSYYTSYTWAPNVHIFSSLEKIELEQINIYGFGFTDFYCTNCNIKNVKLDDPEKLNILVIHGNVDNKSAQEKPYNDLSSTDLSNIGFDYIALGHIHKANKIKENIIYPGSPISFGFDELGKHGMVVGEIKKGNINTEYIVLDDREFIERQVDVTSLYSKEEIIENINGLYLEENNFYKMILIGKRNFEINPTEILKLINQKNVIKIKDDTKIKYALEKIKEEDNLKGIFVKQMLLKLQQEQNQEEKEIIEKAIEIGLDLLNEEK